MVELLVAFVGGVLSLLSPCSALLLPAFFAYAFPSPARLALRTAIFYAGMLTLLLPLGVGAGALGSVLMAQRGALMLLAGLVLVVIGVVQFFRGGFELPSPSGGTTTPMTPERAASTYALGLGASGSAWAGSARAPSSAASSRSRRRQAAPCPVLRSSPRTPPAWRFQCSPSRCSGSDWARRAAAGSAGARSGSSASSGTSRSWSRA